MKRILCVLIFFAFGVGCKKSAEDVTDQCSNATVQFTDPLADGFGWTLRLSNGKVLVPNKIDEAFKQDNLPVSVCYVYTGEKAACRCFNPPPIVQITNISLR